MIEAVFPFSNAWYSPLEVEDRILSIDQHSLVDEEIPCASAKAIVANHPHDRPLTLTFRRSAIDALGQADRATSVSDPQHLWEDLRALEPDQTLTLRKTTLKKTVAIDLTHRAFTVNGLAPFDEQRLPSLSGQDIDHFPRVLASLERQYLNRDNIRDLNQRLASLQTSSIASVLPLVSYLQRRPEKLPQSSHRLAAYLKLQARSFLDSPAEALYGLAGLLFRMETENVKPLRLVRKDLAGVVKTLEGVLSQTDGFLEQAFARLSAEEKQFIEDNWHLTQTSLTNADDPGSDTRYRRFIKVLEISRKIDLTRLVDAAVSSTRLADPLWLRALQEVMERHRHRTEKILSSVQTAYGKIVIGGFGNTTHRHKDAVILIDPQGNDSYASLRTSAGISPLRVIIDLQGDDVYESTAAPSQGGALMGVSLLLDQAGDDRYLAREWAQGSAFLGVGLLMDLQGSDVYRSKFLSQGAGFFGIGLLFDAQGDDAYQADGFSQAIGLPYGLGVLMDMGGNDRYFAKGGIKSGYGTPGVFTSVAQGSGFGLRQVLPGGMGALIDTGGADRYEAGEFAQGGGYFFGFGLLADDGYEGDNYLGSRYNMGYSAHQAIGSFIDSGGDDNYYSNGSAMAGLAWDESLSYFYDQGGSDTYSSGDFSLGAAAHNSYGIFIDTAGEDRYLVPYPGCVQSNAYHGGYSFSLFLDLGDENDQLPEILAGNRVNSSRQEVKITRAENSLEKLFSTSMTHFIAVSDERSACN